MYKYYTQRTRTDCLLTVAENFVQKPREKFNNINWNKINGQKYLRYKSFADILVKHSGGARLILKVTVELDRFPAIIGWGFNLGGIGPINHALFWDGRAAICPYLNKPVDLADIDASYVFLHPKYDKLINSGTITPTYYKNIKDVCKFWDKGCLERNIKRNKDINFDLEQTKSKINTLITLKYQDKYYIGNLDRANSERK